MKSRQRFPDEESSPQAHHQLSLAIDTPADWRGRKARASAAYG